MRRSADRFAVRRRLNRLSVFSVTLGIVLAGAGHPTISLATQAKHKASAKKPARKQVAATTSTLENAKGSFEEFCTEWMQKLATRERDNLTHIKWEGNSGDVHGSYTGYTKDHTCAVTEGTQKVPIGTIKYQEVRYEKRGPSNAQAEQGLPRPVEVFDVTEIFRYTKGKWDYQ